MTMMIYDDVSVMILFFFSDWVKVFFIFGNNEFFTMSSKMIIFFVAKNIIFPLITNNNGL